MIAAIEILSLLRVCGASLNLYNKIVCWVKNRIPHSMNEMLPTWEKVVNYGEMLSFTIYGTGSEKVTLPSMNLPIEIPVNPLLGCIYSLLQDQNLMQDMNLIFPDINDPSIISPYLGKYSEVKWVWHINLFKKKHQNFGNAVQIPLIFYRWNCN